MSLPWHGTATSFCTCLLKVCEIDQNRQSPWPAFDSSVSPSMFCKILPFNVTSLTGADRMWCFHSLALIILLRVKHCCEHCCMGIVMKFDFLSLGKFTMGLFACFGCLRSWRPTRSMVLPYFTSKTSCELLLAALNTYPASCFHRNLSRASKLENPAAVTIFPTFSMSTPQAW